MMRHSLAGWRAVMTGVVVALLTATPDGFAADHEYTVKPGDRLIVTVWKDPDLSREILVAPDGEISFPLAGNLTASGLTVDDLSTEIAARLGEFIDEPVVTVSLIEVRGARIYVIGKVNRPGMYILDGTMDVMQALSLAGGMTTYADVDGIRILRRNGDRQVAYRFAYNEVARGKDLEQNILLESGDTVVVN